MYYSATDECFSTDWKTLLHFSLPWKQFCDKWVHVTTAWRVLGLRMEERPSHIE